MTIQQLPLPSFLPKTLKFGMDKVTGEILGYPTGFYPGDSLLSWAEFYYHVYVKGTPLKTE